jgi:hypothetical protein
MKWFVDGDALALVEDDFVNLQESNAIFIPVQRHIAKWIMNKFPKSQIENCLKGRVAKIKQSKFWANEVKHCEELVETGKASRKMDRLWLGQFPPIERYIRILDYLYYADYQLQKTLSEEDN